MRPTLLGVLLGRVEVDVIGHLERQEHLDSTLAVEVGRHEAGLAVVGQQLAEVLADAPPGGGSGCHERVEDRGSEHFHVGVGEPGGACSAGAHRGRDPRWRHQCALGRRPARRRRRTAGSRRERPSPRRRRRRCSSAGPGGDAAGDQSGSRRRSANLVAVTSGLPAGEPSGCTSRSSNRLAGPGGHRLAS